MIWVDWQAFPSRALGRLHTCNNPLHNSVSLLFDLVLFLRWGTHANLAGSIQRALSYLMPIMLRSAHACPKHASECARTCPTPIGSDVYHCTSLERH
jgi:hypothetical protein